MPHQSNMTKNAPLKNISFEIDRPHDTARKAHERRQGRVASSTEQKLRILCHYQGLLIQLNNEKVEHGHA